MNELKIVPTILNKIFTHFSTNLSPLKCLDHSNKEKLNAISHFQNLHIGQSFLKFHKTNMHWSNWAVGLTVVAVLIIFILLFAFFAMLEDRRRTFWECLFIALVELGIDP